MRSFAVAAPCWSCVACRPRSRRQRPARRAPPIPRCRAARNAWDRPTGDDPDRLIVTFQPGTSTFEPPVEPEHGRGRGDTARPCRSPGRRSSTPGPVTAGGDDRRRCGRTSRVERVSVDHRRFREADPTAEKYWTEQWGLDNTGQDIYEGSPGRVGPSTPTSTRRRPSASRPGLPGTVVAVIDDGVDFSHPDLAARAWTNPGESGDGKETNGIDDDANGYIDDVHGWDFCHDDNTVHDFDDDYHGTHVAGIIAASLDGSRASSGSRRASRSWRSSSSATTADCGFDSMAIAAIDYAKSFGVRIANASWGGIGAPTDAPELYDAIRDSGMLFVAAAGNDSGDNDDGPWTTLPASFDLPNIVSVAAIDDYRRAGLVLELRRDDRRHRRSRRGRS